MYCVFFFACAANREASLKSVVRFRMFEFGVVFVCGVDILRVEDESVVVGVN